MHMPHFLAWIAVLWHHAVHGTLPPVPTESAGVFVPPVNPNVETPAHGLTLPPLPPGVYDTSTTHGETTPVPTVDNSPDHPAVGAIKNPPPPPGGPPVPATLPGASEPDSNCLVTLSGLVGTKEEHTLFQIPEVVHAQTPGSDLRLRGEANLAQANGAYVVEEKWLGICYVPVKIAAAGLSPPYYYWVVDASVPGSTQVGIPHSWSMPAAMSRDGKFDLSTVKGVTDWVLNNLAVEAARA